MSLRITKATNTSTILKYAEEELGVKLDDTLERAEIIAKVKELEAEAGEEESINDEDDESVEEKEASIMATKKARPTKAVITIHQPPSADEESEPDTHWTGGLNGRNYQVQYGEEVTVPYGIYDIIKNAKQTKYFKKRDPQTQQVITETKVVARFPFTLIKLID